MNLPEVIIVGDVEFLFLGMAIAAGMPKLARRILESRYGPSLGGNSDDLVKCDDCPTPDDCAALGCRREK